MRSYIDVLKVWVAEHPPFWGQSGEPSVIEFLQDAYQEFNPIQSRAVSVAFQVMEQELEDMPFDRRDRLLLMAADLGRTLEAEAFRSGVCLGVSLMQELGDS